MPDFRPPKGYKQGSEYFFCFFYFRQERRSDCYAENEQEAVAGRSGRWEKSYAFYRRPRSKGEALLFTEVEGIEPIIIIYQTTEDDAGDMVVCHFNFVDGNGENLIFIKKKEKLVIVNQYYLEKDKVQDEVVVLGGGLAGCEASIHLAHEGKKVIVVETRDELAPDANVRHRPLMLQEMDGLVEIRTGLRGARIPEDGVECMNQEDHKVTVPGKTVICALGQRSRTDVADELRDCDPYVCIIGDCAKVATITNAVYQGYYAALDI